MKKKFAAAVVGSTQLITSVALIAATALSVPGVQTAVHEKVSQIATTMSARTQHFSAPACHDPASCGMGTEARGDLFGTVSNLDDGHGGKDPGAERGDVQEKKLTQAIVMKAASSIYKRAGWVFIDRPDDSTYGLDNRVNMAWRLQKLKDDNLEPKVKDILNVSIHINSLPKEKSEVAGVQVFYTTKESYPLAYFMYQSLLRNLKVPGHGLIKSHLYWNKNNPPPAVLLEVGYITNDKERELLQTDAYQQKIGDAVAQGESDCINNKYKRKGAPLLPAESADEPQAPESTQPAPAQPAPAQPAPAQKSTQVETKK